MIALAAAAASKSPSAWDQPGTLGFLVVFGMAIILFFIFRSLARHLRKINEAARLEVLQAEALQAEQPEGQHVDALQEGSSSPRPLAGGKVIGPPAENGARRTS